METKQATSVLEETRTYHHGIGLRGELTLETVIRYRAAVAIEWIKEDLRRGVQPENIKTFSELHDVVDASMYLLDEDHPIPKAGNFYDWEELDVEGVNIQLTRMMDIINDWLETRDYVRNHPLQ
ncbi:hypothetical protein [uncultured Thalassolituus sp.]|uniref:hypothetical protein n=1 Tax=uncultured Thalassolituus sp. TaxID=285273 RepID=UPI002621F471|nr:hypothetical protein [uncultured Thalassolituus sp.]